MNTSGFGVAVNAIVYNGVTNTARSAYMLNPCSAVNKQANLACNSFYTAALPPGTPSTVYCQSRGGSPGIFSIQSYVTGGATADNPELEARLQVDPANCASYALESLAVFNTPNSGELVVNATATAGAAIWLRGFVYQGVGQPTDIEDLKANGLLKWDVLVAGPFDFNTEECTALRIPFSFEGDPDNLYFVADGVAKSVNFEVICPEILTFACNQPVEYTGVGVVGGCGAVTLAFDPPASALPAAVTTVTVTATDEAGNTAQCSFVADNSARANPVAIRCPGDLVFTCDQSVVLPDPQVSGGCGEITWSYSPAAEAIPVGQTTTVVATAVDSVGNTATCSFTVTRQGLDFEGFLAPINGVGGDCNSPVRQVNRGSICPVKFKVSCSGTPVTAGQPTLSIRRCSTGQPVGGGSFSRVLNEWHFNWDTSGLNRGVYELVATLQDGSTQSVSIRLK